MRKRSKKILIEFAGLPGAGKTIIANLLIRKLKISRVVCLDSLGLIKLENNLCVNLGRLKPKVLRKLIERIIYIIIFPVSAFKLYMLAFLARPFCCKRLFIVQSALKSFCFMKKYNQDASAPVIIKDELFLHDIYRLLFGARMESIRPLLTGILKSAYSDNNIIVLYLNASPEECVKRFLLRNAPVSRFNRYSKKEKVEKFLLSKGIYNEIKDILYRTGFRNIIIIEANSSEDKVISDAVAAVMSFF